MGQPSSPVALRCGHTQLWSHAQGILSLERGQGEYTYRFHVGARLAVLFFQALVLQPHGSLWVGLERKNVLWARSRAH